MIFAPNEFSLVEYSRGNCHCEVSSETLTYPSYSVVVLKDLKYGFQLCRLWIPLSRNVPGGLSAVYVNEIQFTESENHLLKYWDFKRSCSSRSTWFSMLMDSIVDGLGYDCSYQVFSNKFAILSFKSLFSCFIDWQSSIY